MLVTVRLFREEGHIEWIGRMKVTGILLESNPVPGLSFLAYGRRPSTAPGSSTAMKLRPLQEVRHLDLLR
jgi:hypothetical protein